VCIWFKIYVFTEEEEEEEEALASSPSILAVPIISTSV